MRDGVLSMSRLVSRIDLELVLGFLVDEGVLELALPGGVRRVGVAGEGVAARPAR